MPAIAVMTNDLDKEFEIMDKTNLPVNNLNLTEGLYGFRINVDNIDEAFNEFKEKNCEIIVPPFETTVGKNMIIREFNGVFITVIEHSK